MNWDSLDWEVLDRLRETFLSDAKAAGPYWHTITDLECYDFTYGERIGWKWDAVLAELKLRGWAPAAGGNACGEQGRTILDWGCGSGIAGRRVLDFFGPQNFSALFVHDHSSLAMEFAEHKARRVFPSLPVERADYRLLNGNTPVGLLVVSHVLNELNDVARAELAGLLARAQAVIWVEPGTHEVSRALVGWREQLRGAGFQVVAPCTHQVACGLLTPENERHWCHHFADPPTGIFADSDWVKFGQRAGIDLRSLPYSFLVLDRQPVTQPDGASRILGDARLYKGYAKIFNCSAAGVEELMLQQRADKELFKALKRARGPLLYRWTRDKTQIVAAESALK